MTFKRLISPLMCKLCFDLRPFILINVAFLLLSIIFTTSQIFAEDILSFKSFEKSSERDRELAEFFENDNLLMSTINSETLTKMSGFHEGTRDQFSKAVLDILPLPKKTSELKCLAEAIYFESRGENLTGQAAVGEVIINRMLSQKFPDSICGVVSEGASRLNACQFSYNCDGKLEVINEKVVYERILKLSKILLEPSARVLTGGATFYHSKGVNPNWALSFEVTKEIGQHVFYKQ